MPKFHDEEKLKELLIKHNVPLTDAVKRGDFYRKYFDWDTILKQYQNGASIRDLCYQYNLSYDVIRENLYRNGANFRAFSTKGSSKYFINEKLFFPTITPVGAYILGWIYSDGCVDDNLSFLDITLADKDADHLSYLASLFTDKPISKTYYGYTLRVFGKDFVTKLAKTYNILPCKSHKNFEIPLELFSDECIPYLLLGLFEGDGNISSKHLGANFLLTENTWNSLQDYFPLFTEPTIRKLNEYGLIQINLSGRNYFCVLQYIYFNTYKIKPLQRKFDRFIIQLNRSRNGITSPFRKLAVNMWDSLNLQQ